MCTEKNESCMQSAHIFKYSNIIHSKSADRRFCFAFSLLPFIFNPIVFFLILFFSRVSTLFDTASQADAAVIIISMFYGK